MNALNTPRRWKPSPALIATSAVGLALAWSWWPSLRRDGGPMGGRSPVFARVPGADVLGVPALVASQGSGRAAQPARAPWGLALIAAGSLAGAGGGPVLSGLVRGAGPADLAWRGWPSWPGAGRPCGGPAPSIAFLVFMIPLPYRVETALGYPLQRVGDDRQHLRPPDARAAGRGRGEHHPDRRRPDRRRRGVQRPGHAPDVLRRLRRRSSLIDRSRPGSIAS